MKSFHHRDHRARREVSVISVISVVIILFLACARNVTRDDWQRMSPNEKTLYAKSLIGGEVARERKGGDRANTLQPQEVIAAIDAAYASGDMRNAEAIFNSLAQRPDSPPQPPPASREGG